MIKQTPVIVCAAACGALAAVVTACSSGPAISGTVQVPGPTVTVTRTATTTAGPESTVTRERVVHRVRTVTATATATVTTSVRPTHHAAPNTYTYVISGGDGAASVVTYTEHDAIEQATNVSLPWHKTVTAGGILQQVSAQNDGGGTIVCKIFGPTGHLVSEHKSTGDYATVSCQH